ncbi:hypothetical protein ABH941_007354 [Streptacidiphilus sp. EB103A]
MYDPMGEFFPLYGAGAYAPAQDRVRAAPYEPSGRRDERVVGAASRLSYPTVEAWGALGGWETGGDFLPRPGDPVKDSAARAGTAVPAPRRSRRRAGPPAASPVLRCLFEVLTAATVIVVCLLGYMLSYGPLQQLASPRVPTGLSQPWPVIVYGPWLAGGLSVLRAALEGRQAMHSWVVVVLFSTVATGLCVADVPRTLPDMVVAGLPPITAVVSLHQLVRQISCSRRSTRRRHTSRRASHRASR